MSKKNIAIIDWSWKGHHPAYFSLFARTLLELGCRVHAFCPSPEDLQHRLSDLPEGLGGRLSCETLHGWASAPRGTPMRLKPVISAARSYISLRRKLARSNYPFDLLFFSCIYDWEFFYHALFRGFFPWRWSGLYLHSFGFRATNSPIYSWHRQWSHPERFASDPNLVALATLDEGIKEKVESLTGRGKCVIFPDIADASTPESGQNTLAAKLRRFAGGRPVIMLCGMLYPQRGVEAFLKVAMANPQWCFALIGEIPYFADERLGKSLLDDFLRQHAFGFFHPLKVPEGAVYNSLVAASDVIWNIHIDWPGSSNTLTKAALFEKPVVVGDKHLLAERVREYRLGEICSEDSEQSISAALNRLLSEPLAWRSANRPNWGAYREAHSTDRLREAFSTILAKI
jgi:hypothetical protein